MAIDFLSIEDRFTVVQINLAADEPWTIAFRAKKKGTDSQCYFLGTEAGYSPRIVLGWNGTDIIFRNCAGGQSTWVTAEDLTEWRHYMFTAAGDGNVTLYLDNVSQGEQARTSSFLFTEVAAAKGTYDFVGLVSELALFDKVLNAQERAQVYGGVSGIANIMGPFQVGNLEAYWPLEDAANALVPSTIIDASGNNHTGTPVDNPIGCAIPTNARPGPLMLIEQEFCPDSGIVVDRFAHAGTVVDRFAHTGTVEKHCE